jgi:hypothetical protein
MIDKPCPVWSFQGIATFRAVGASGSIIAGGILESEAPAVYTTATETVSNTMDEIKNPVYVGSFVGRRIFIEGFGDEAKDEKLAKDYLEHVVYKQHVEFEEKLTYHGPESDEAYRDLK